MRRVTRLTKQTSGQFTVNRHKTTHFQSCLGHFLSLVITNTYTHNLNPDIMWGEGEKKFSLEGQKCSNWCQHQRYYGPMKYLQPP